ncbi:MAG: hypothetical protein ACJ8DX_05950, partial [Xanthobacteraceae bacterium]
VHRSRRRQEEQEVGVSRQRWPSHRDGSTKPGAGSRRVLLGGEGAHMTGKTAGNIATALQEGAR